MAAITLKPFLSSKKLKLDTGLIYLVIASINIFVLAFLYSGNLSKFIVSSLILVIANSFFNGLFVKAFFDAEYNEAKNLLKLSVFFFILTCTIPPILSYQISSLLNFPVNLYLLFTLAIYINSLSPLWTPEKYLKIVFVSLLTICILLLTKTNPLTLLTIVDFVVILYLAVTELRKSYSNEFRITQFYIVSLLISGLTNFLMHFLMIFTAIHLIRLGYLISDVMLSMLLIFIPLAIVFRFYSDIEDLTSNVLRGSLDEIKRTYNKIYTLYKNQILMSFYFACASMIVIALASHFGFISIYVVPFSTYYLSLGLLTFSLKYLEIYYKLTATYIWILYSTFCVLSMILLNFPIFLIVNIFLIVSIIVFSLKKRDAENGLKNVCKYMLKYSWGG